MEEINIRRTGSRRVILPRKRLIQGGNYLCTKYPKFTLGEIIMLINVVLVRGSVDYSNGADSKLLLYSNQLLNNSKSLNIGMELLK